MKANELMIAERNGNQHYCKNCDDCCQPYNSTDDCFRSAIQAMELKDKQFAKEKQEWIDKVGKWINDNYFEYLHPITYHEPLQNSIDINDFVNDLKKAMEE